MHHSNVKSPSCYDVYNFVYVCYDVGFITCGTVHPPKPAAALRMSLQLHSACSFPRFISRFDSIVMASFSAVDFSEDNGSFQNQPNPSAPVKRRKRGMACVTSEMTNTASQDSTRESKRVAEAKLRGFSNVKRPRGDSSLGGKAKSQKQHSSSSQIMTEQEEESVSTLKKLLKMHHELFENGSKYISEYFERNTSLEIQKASVIMVFSTALNVWGDGILEACEKASDVSGFSRKTVHKWVTEYYLSLLEIDASEIDDDSVELTLSSVRGKALKNPHSLIKSDEFCQSARQFVRDNACVKGEPNLTAEMFRRWIKSEHNCDISGETARKWLHTLGFKQVNHTKGVYFDGHERDDVVAYRKTFVNKLSELDRRCLYDGHDPDLLPGEKPLIVVHHDESTFLC